MSFSAPSLLNFRAGLVNNAAVRLLYQYLHTRAEDGSRGLSSFWTVTLHQPVGGRGDEPWCLRSQLEFEVESCSIRTLSIYGGRIPVTR